MFELSLKFGNGGGVWDHWLTSGLVGVIVTLSIFAVTFWRSVATRKEDLTFQRSKLALERMIDISNDALAKNAQLIIDWQQAGHAFKIPVFKAGDKKLGERAEIISGHVLQMVLCYRHLYKEGECAPGAALPAPDANTIRFVRDCFDRLFYHFSRLQRLIVNEVIDATETRYPINYYLNCICIDDLTRFVFEHFLLVNQYDDAIDLLISIEEDWPLGKWRFLKYERWPRGSDLARPAEPWRGGDLQLSLSEVRRLTGRERSLYCYRRLDAFLSSRQDAHLVSRQEIDANYSLD